jgi:serine phosphatase RsbU (regulator of sigma subunit)
VPLAAPSTVVSEVGTVDRGLVADVLAPLLGAAALPEALAACADAVARRLGGAWAAIWTLDAGRRVLHLEASAGDVHRQSERHQHVPLGQFKVGLIATERLPHLTNDVLHDPRLTDQVWAVEERLEAFAGYPLLVEDRLVGVVGLYAREPLSERTIQALGSVADLLALGIERKRAEGQLRTESRTVEALYDIATAVASELDLQRAVQLVTDAATELTGAAFGAFFYNLVDDAGASYTLFALSGVDRDTFAGFPLPRNTPLFAPMFSGGPAVRLHDVTEHPDYGRNPPNAGMPEGHLPVRSYLAVPVVARGGEVLGGLFFGHPRAGVFTARAERIALGIAGHAAVAIERARLFEQASQIAVTLQRSLLPEHLPELAGASLAARYVPASRHAEVGGDWYDALVLPDGTTALTVGDAAGHDIGAAAVMGQVRSALRAYAMEATSPATALARVDRFVSVAGNATFATALHGTFDATARTFTFARAGHPPPVVLGADGTARAVDSEAHPPLGLGLLDDLPADAVTTVSLEPGSSLVLYTDGLIERRTTPIDVGVEHLLEALKGQQASTPEELSAHLLARLGVGAGDDIALLVLRVDGRPEG